MIHCLLHLTTNLNFDSPQLSCPIWTGMRRAKIWYESFICFPTLYIPPNMSESECNSQVDINGGLYIPKPGVLLALAEQLDNLRTAPPRPMASNPESGDRHGTKDKTPKKIKLGDTRDTLKKHHKSCKEKSQLKHSLTEKSPASLSCKHDVEHQANRLGDVVAQACLSIARKMKVVKNTHNLRMAEALLVRQHLESLCQGY